MRQIIIFVHSITHTMPYVRRKRTTRRRTMRPRRTTRTTRKAPYKRRPKRPKVSKIRKTVNTLTPIAESKLQGIIKQMPNKIFIMAGGREVGSTIVALGENLVPYLTAAEQQTPMALWNFAQGIGKNQRDGRSLFIKQTTCSVRVEYTPHFIDWGNTKLITPQKVRILIIRGKRVNEDEPNQVTANLFLDQLGNNKGLDSVLSTYALDKLKVNRKRWDVIMDRRTILSPSSVTSKDGSLGTADNINSTRQFSSKYPSSKDFNFSIPMNKKVRYNSPTSAQPSSLDTNYFMVMLNMAVGYDFDGAGTLPTMEPGLIGTTFFGKTAALDL